MQLTPAHRYAIGSLVLLAELEPGESLASRDLCRSAQLPKPYLVQVLGKLARAGIVFGAPGAKGGYRLAMEPEQVSLLDIVEAIDGQIGANGVVVLAGLSKDSQATVEKALAAIVSDGRERLASVTISSLRVAKAAIPTPAPPRRER